MAITRGAAAAEACHVSGSSITLTYTGTTAGRGLVVGAISYGSGDPNITLSSVTISGESNATIIAGSLVRLAVLNDAALNIAYLPEITAGGNKTITANFSAILAAGALFVQEYQGQDTATFYDTAVNTGTGNGANSSITVTTNTANDMVFGLNVNGSAEPTAGANFTIAAGSVCFWGEGSEDDVDVGAAGVITVPWTHLTADWVISAAGFKVPAAYSGSPSPHVSRNIAFVRLRQF